MALSCCRTAARRPGRRRTAGPATTTLPPMRRSSTSSTVARPGVRYWRVSRHVPDVRRLVGERVNADLHDKIVRFGWTLIGVDDTPAGQAWTYTIGLADHDHPELVVAGVSIDRAMVVLTDLDATGRGRAARRRPRHLSRRPAGGAARRPPRARRSGPRRRLAALPRLAGLARAAATGVPGRAARHRVLQLPRRPPTPARPRHGHVRLGGAEPG
jgi:Domain of unknown function (DUF4262)